MSVDLGVFSRPTIVEATQILARKSHADVTTFALRFGLEDIAPEEDESGYTISTARRANKLAEYFIKQVAQNPPDGLLPDGRTVRNAIMHIIEISMRDVIGVSWWDRSSYSTYKHLYPGFDRALQEDGYTVENGKLEPKSSEPPETLPESPAPPLPSRRKFGRVAAASPKLDASSPPPIGGTPPNPVSAPLASASTATKPREPSSPSSVSLPPKLIQAQRERKIIPFIGAGLSLGRDVTGNFPSWRSLPIRLLEACDEHGAWHDAADKRAMWSIFVEDIENRSPRPMPLKDLLRQLDVLKAKLGHDYGAALTAIFRPADAKPGAAHRSVLALGSQVIMTTNYDRLLEMAEQDPGRLMFTGVKSPAALEEIRSGRNVLFKIHGSAEDHNSVVLTLAEYSNAHSNPAYRKVLAHLMISHSFLFVGYGMSDPNDLDVLLASNADELGGATSMHYALLQSSADRQADVERGSAFRERFRVTVLWYDSHEQVAPTLDALARGQV